MAAASPDFFGQLAIDDVFDAEGNERSAMHDEIGCHAMGKPSELPASQTQAADQLIFSSQRNDGYAGRGRNRLRKQAAMHMFQVRSQCRLLELAAQISELGFLLQKQKIGKLQHIDI